MDISSINFGGDNYKAARTMSLSQNQGILSSIPEVKNSAFSLDFLKQVQDSKLITSRVIDYYDSKVSSTVSNLEKNDVDVTASTSDVVGYNSSAIDDYAQKPENSEDIKTIVDEIIARNMEVTSGTILDLQA
tara:strand:+ start:2250 stop:2645 length:396 start_codon:yes stop_codon:yes gene_type:complete